MKRWNNTKLRYAELSILFDGIFADTDIPQYTANNIIDWVSSLFDGWYSVYQYNPDRLGDVSVLRSKLKYYWGINRARVAHYVETTQYDYNPIENYDMTETSTDTRETAAGGKSTAKGTNKVNTYLNDSAAYPDSENQTDSTTETTSTDVNTHKLSRHGNIGVTTSQQMIQSERSLIVEPLAVLYDVFLPCFEIDPVIIEE